MGVQCYNNIAICQTDSKITVALHGVSHSIRDKSQRIQISMQRKNKETIYNAHFPAMRTRQRDRVGGRGGGSNGEGGGGRESWKGGGGRERDPKTIQC